LIAFIIVQRLKRNFYHMIRMAADPPLPANEARMLTTTGFPRQ
jgi:hypothetical protein